MADINLRDFLTDAYVFTEYDSVLRVMGGIEYDGQGAALTGTNGIQRLIVMSDVSGSDIGLRLTTDAPDTKIVIQSDGSVFGGSVGVVMQGDGQRLLNRGVISSEDLGVLTLNEDTVVKNSGTISALDGVDLFDTGKLINKGVINADRVGVYAEGDLYADIINRGEINAGEVAVSAADLDLFLTNRGSMSGRVVVDAEEAGQLNFVNRGDLVSTDLDEGAAILGSDGADTVRNRGSITGEVDLGAGDDVFTSRGGELIDADVYGGDGNDRLIGSHGDDDLSGDAGDDKLIGHRGDDVLDGGDGNDILRGGQGSDWLDGGDGDDLLSSGSGAEDLLEGGAGDDKLVANGDANSNAYLYGDDGADLLVHKGDGFAELFGGDGDDVFRVRTGETGETVMTGGAGDDLFFGNNKGVQTVSYDGSAEDYQIVLLADGTTSVTDLRDDGTDGTDTLSNIEFVQFGDGTVLEWNTDDGVWA